MSRQGEKERFTERFKIALETAGYGKTSLKKLGEMFDCSAPAVWAWKNAKKIPDTERAILISKKLNIAFEYLMTGRGTRKPGITLSPEEQLLCVSMNQLSPEGKRQVLEYAAFILEKDGAKN